MSGPLNGIRVLEVAHFVAGPLAARLLAELGAEVIKIEEPGSGDPMRAWIGELYSPWFVAHNAGKLSISLRLGTTTATEVLDRLLPSIDVLIENFRPGVIDRIGLGYDRVCARAPRLIFCSISGVGASGPYSKRACYDTVAQSLSGLLGLSMNPLDPQPFGAALADTAAGLFAANAVLAALIQRSCTGQGQYVATSVLEASFGLLSEPYSVFLNSGEVPDATSRRQAAQAYVFRCRDEQLLAVHLSSSVRNWEAFLRVIGRPDMASNPLFVTRADRVRAYEVIHAEVQSEILGRTRDAWLELLNAADVPSAPVYRLDEALTDPQVMHANLIREASRPNGAERVRWMASPLRFSNNRAGATAPPPLLGQHTAEVLHELGYDDQAMRKLHADGDVYINSLGRQ